MFQKSAQYQSMWPDKKACQERGPFLISWPAVICVIKNGPWENEMALPVKNLAVAGVSRPNGKTYLKSVFSSRTFLT